jgi:NADH:ubiquinone reductase (H+-translocating)
MTPRLTRAISIGAATGILAGLVGVILGSALIGTDLSRSLGGWVVHLITSVGIGVAYVLWFERTAESRAIDLILIGLLVGVTAWALLALNLTPVLMGQGVQWSAKAASAALPALIAYLLQGVALTVGARLLSALALPVPDADDDPAEMADQPAPTQRRIVILGGGFAGVTTAQHLEKLFEHDPDMEIMLVSNTNHLLFTPMLAEVTASGVEGQHISPALRTFFRRVRVVRGEVAHLDIHERVIKVESGSSFQRAFAFDHLVFAMGSVPNFFGNKNIEQHSFTFKTLTDAMLIRNHVIERLERADTESDPVRRQRMLTFVVVGAGFAGAELIGGLNDFVRGSLWYFPHIPPQEVQIVSIHPAERILPELSASLGDYAREKMAARGVTFRLKTRVTDAAPSLVITDQGEIAADTVIWTAGNVPHPLVKQSGVEVDKRGSALTDETLRVKGQTHIWALGDCAVIPDMRNEGKNCPPTAQFALREAKVLAKNIHAALHDKPLKPFSFNPIGSLAVLGHNTACAEIRGFKFSGLLAWLMWRGIYLVKLPSLEKRIRVLLDWIVDLFFPRDLVYFQLPTRRPVIADADIKETT